MIYSCNFKDFILAENFAESIDTVLTGFSRGTKFGGEHEGHPGYIGTTSKEKVTLDQDDINMLIGTPQKDPETGAIKRVGGLPESMWQDALIYRHNHALIDVLQKRWQIQKSLMKNLDKMHVRAWKLRTGQAGMSDQEAREMIARSHPEVQNFEIPSTHTIPGKGEFKGKNFVIKTNIGNLIKKLESQGFDLTYPKKGEKFSKDTVYGAGLSGDIEIPSYAKGYIFMSERQAQQAIKDLKQVMHYSDQRGGLHSDDWAKSRDERGFPVPHEPDDPSDPSIHYRQVKKGAGRRSAKEEGEVGQYKKQFIRHMNLGAYKPSDVMQMKLSQLDPNNLQSFIASLPQNKQNAAMQIVQQDGKVVNLIDIFRAPSIAPYTSTHPIMQNAHTVRWVDYKGKPGTKTFNSEKEAREFIQRATTQGLLNKAKLPQPMKDVSQGIKSRHWLLKQKFEAVEDSHAHLQPGHIEYVPGGDIISDEPHIVPHVNPGLNLARISDRKGYRSAVDDILTQHFKHELSGRGKAKYKKVPEDHMDKAHELYTQGYRMVDGKLAQVEEPAIGTHGINKDWELYDPNVHLGGEHTGGVSHAAISPTKSTPESNWIDPLSARGKYIIAQNREAWESAAPKAVRAALGLIKKRGMAAQAEQLGQDHADELEDIVYRFYLTNLGHPNIGDKKWLSSRGADAISDLAQRNELLGVDLGDTRRGREKGGGISSLQEPVGSGDEGEASDRMSMIASGGDLRQSLAAKARELEEIGKRFSGHRRFQGKEGSWRIPSLRATHKELLQAKAAGPGQVVQSDYKDIKDKLADSEINWAQEVAKIPKSEDQWHNLLMRRWHDDNMPPDEQVERVEDFIIRYLRNAEGLVQLMEEMPQAFQALAQGDEELANMLQTYALWKTGRLNQHLKTTTAIPQSQTQTQTQPQGQPKLMEPKTSTALGQHLSQRRAASEMPTINQSTALGQHLSQPQQAPPAKMGSMSDFIKKRNVGESSLIETANGKGGFLRREFAKFVLNKLDELVGTGVVAGTHPKKKGEFNWWGAPGSTGETIKGDPIKPKSKKKK